MAVTEERSVPEVREPEELEAVPEGPGAEVQPALEPEAEMQPALEPEVEASAVAQAAEEQGEAAEAAEAKAEQPQPSQEGRAWYVVHCYSGYENRVKKTLERRIESMGMQDKIFRVVVPVEEEVELRDGKRRTVERRLFPGYILVDMILTEESWYVVRNTPNVTGFVGTGNKPTPLSQEQVDKILQRLESEAPRVKVSYRVGQKVRIVEGPFADFIGVVDEIYPDKGRVRILVSIFGRETPMEVDFLQIERV
jgi:transcriptional antiterminator NusG